jgi:alpha-tubulin suppressor-like RCC1 family protein
VYAINGTSYAVTSSNALYAWGRNDRGQVGAGNTDPVILPMEVLSSGVADLAFGAYGEHMFVRSGTSLSGTGESALGQLGIADPPTLIDAFTPVTISGCTTPNSGKHTKAVGDDYSLLICDGTLYSTGENNEGQLGAPISWAEAPVQLLP